MCIVSKTHRFKKQATMTEAVSTPDIVWSSRARSDSISSIASTSDDGERRLLARERNKEHARKTRLRKKEQLQSLKSRVNELEEEGRRLKQQIEACSVASILVGLSHGSSTGQEGVSGADSSAQPKNYGETLSGGKRKRFLSLDGEEPSPPPMELNVKGHITLVGGPAGEGKTQINWKTGVYFDDQGQRHQLTKKELEELRRERNRMHAKMTRDRKKCYIASIKRVITKLEDQNQHLRDTLDKSQALSANAAAAQLNVDSADEEASTSESSTGHKNLEASANALSVLDFAGQAASPSSIMMGSNALESDFERLDSPPLLCSVETKKSLDEKPSTKLAEKKMDLSHILPSGAFTFNSNMYAVG